MYCSKVILESSSVTSGLRIALIEGQDLSRSKEWSPPQNEISNRTSSLTPASVSFLERIGAWDHLALERVQPYNEMQVWDGANGSRIQFDWTMEARKYNTIPRTVATMVENANLTRSLLRRLEEVQDDRLSIFSNTKVSSIANGDDAEGFNMSAWPVLSLEGSGSPATPSSLAARLLIGADGANSPARLFAGIASNGWDYGRHGVVATLNLSQDNFSDKVAAYQRFLPTLGGPIAILPFPDGKASLVWSTTPQNAAYLKSLPTDSLITMINAAFRLSMADLSYMMKLTTAVSNSHADELAWRLSHTEVPNYVPPIVIEVQSGTLASFPLKFKHADTYISPRVAIAGDAAHTIHPLAGQGLNLGIGDAKALTATIAQSLEHGADIGDIMSLEQYNADRWRANAKVGGVCDLLHKMYSVESGAFAWARGIGLEAIESMPWAKGLLMKQAEGS